jgi:hypothetical protein
MSDEEKQLYEERRRKRYPWETKKSKRDLDAHHIGAHRSPLFMWKWEMYSKPGKKQKLKKISF